MIIFNRKLTDKINMIKIIIGRETCLQFQLDGCININIGKMLEKLDNKNECLNLLSLSFCEDEEEMKEYLDKMPAQMLFDKLIADSGNGLKEIEIPLPNGKQREPFDFDSLFKRLSGQEDSPVEKPKPGKCPTCGGDGLIDSAGKTHQCEACMKLEAYEKGKKAYDKAKADKEALDRALRNEMIVPKRKRRPRKKGDDNGLQEN